MKIFWPLLSSSNLLRMPVSQSSGRALHHRVRWRHRAGLPNRHLPSGESLMVEKAGCKKRPEPLTCKHSHQSDKAEEWRRGRRQFYQAKNSADGKTGSKCEEHRAGRNGLITHTGSLAALLSFFLLFCGLGSCGPRNELLCDCRKEIHRSALSRKQKAREFLCRENKNAEIAEGIRRFQWPAESATGWCCARYANRADIPSPSPTNEQKKRCAKSASARRHRCDRRGWRDDRSVSSAACGGRHASRSGPAF